MNHWRRYCWMWNVALNESCWPLRYLARVVILAIHAAIIMGLIDLYALVRWVRR